ncbi:hypothetical protein AZE42_12707 [Rhizopogon vesiculosus]|uniref:Uncharacterized protein n=1 Tax=Rhizopogon vesiculosus TaxID=180088 RepID=A0A1J8QXG8_9AGAM|nr:hypothetical protein AZE42_12707 [Rhizopogon vesiculosus]
MEQLRAVPIYSNLKMLRPKFAL